MYVLIGIYLVKGKKFEHISNSELSSYTSSSKAAKLIMLLPLILRIICPLPIPMFAQKHRSWLVVGAAQKSYDDATLWQNNNFK